MEKPLVITTHHLDLPASAEATIRERAADLEHFYPPLVGCSVIVEGPGRHHRQGGRFNVQIDLRVPGGRPIIVNRQTDEDLQLAVREAFDVADRQLEDFARIRRGEVKRHRPPQAGRGWIVRLLREQGYGFIETAEVPSRQVYFHRNSLPENDFEKLQVGQEVRFHEEEGAKGPQASTVVVQD
jgi:cold shock CspA family protein/ribosome-associated translation inhibitor RaiA